MSYERIDNSEQFDGKTRASHEIRYRIARQFVESHDIVLDACCGAGYGQGILEAGRFGVTWLGIDKTPPHPGVIQANLDTESAKEIKKKLPTAYSDYDVFVGLEAIEHLTDKGVATFIELAKCANRYAIISTPIRKNSNPHHKQQFTHEDITRLMSEDDINWELEHYLEQNNLYGVFVFKNTAYG